MTKHAGVLKAYDGPTKAWNKEYYLVEEADVEFSRLRTHLELIKMRCEDDNVGGMAEYIRLHCEQALEGGGK
jgi:hypothetical protein